MKTILTFLLCFLIAGNLLAQDNKLTLNGTIEYTKTINIHAITKQELGPKPDPLTLQMFDEYKKTKPQFINLKSTLVFDKGKTLFTPIPPTERIYTLNNNPMGTQFNKVYTDQAKKTVTIAKQIYADEVLIQDSVRKVTWRLTNERREIAGYTCRRANGLFMDSISVVAFYTDDIRVSGGPESFGGLPGMILSLVVPHENVRFDATKVTVNTADVAKIVPPKSKSKPVTYKQLDALLQGMVKRGAQRVFTRRGFIRCKTLRIYDFRIAIYELELLDFLAIVVYDVLHGVKRFKSVSKAFHKKRFKSVSKAFHKKRKLRHIAIC